MRRRRWEEEEAENPEEDEERVGVARLLNNLTIETSGTEKEVAEGLEAELRM